MKRNKIAAYRAVIDLSQSGLAKIMEVKPYIVREWEEGQRRPAKRTRVRIAKVLNTDMEVLFPDEVDT